jgi:hypothetical protein
LDALRAITVLYKTIHGRPAVPNSYQATAALSPEHIAKCWDMAYQVRRTGTGSRILQGFIDDIFATAVQGMKRQLEKSRDTKSRRPNPREYALMQRRLSNIYISSNELLCKDITHPAIQECITEYSKVVQDLAPDACGYKNFFEGIVTDTLVFGGTLAEEYTGALEIVGTAPAVILDQSLIGVLNAFTQETANMVEVERGSSPGGPCC